MHHHTTPTVRQLQPLTTRHRGPTRRTVLGLAAVVAVACSLLGAATSQAATVTGYETIQGSSTTTNQAVFQTASATCSPGKQLLGPGGFVSAERVALDDITPGSTGVFTQAWETAFGTSAFWSTSAGGVCANPLPLREVVVADSAFDSSDFHTAKAECPLGKFVVGTGAELSGARGGAVLDDITPATNGRSVTATGYEADFGTANDWSIRAYAVCAPAPTGLRMAFGQKTATNKLEIAHATCPDGFTAIGGGGDVTGGTGDAWVTSSLPDSTDRRSWRVSARASTIKGAPRPWTLSAYAMCAIAS